MERPNNKGRLEQILGNGGNSEEAGGLDGPLKWRYDNVLFKEMRVVLVCVSNTGLFTILRTSVCVVPFWGGARLGYSVAPMPTKEPVGHQDTSPRMTSCDDFLSAVAASFVHALRFPPTAVPATRRVPMTTSTLLLTNSLRE